jgi:hypothetical protein
MGIARETAPTIDVPHFAGAVSLSAGHVRHVRPAGRLDPWRSGSLSLERRLRGRAHVHHFELEDTARGLDVEPVARTASDEGLTHRRLDGHAAAVDVRLERADELVLVCRPGGEVADAHEGPDPRATVRGRLDDLGRAHACLEERDPLLELHLLLEEVAQHRIVLEIAILPRLAEPLGQRAPRIGAQRLDLSREAVVARGADQHRRFDVHRQRCHLRLLSVGWRWAIVAPRQALGNGAPAPFRGSGAANA